MQKDGLDLLHLYSKVGHWQLLEHWCYIATSTVLLIIKYPMSSSSFIIGDVD